MSDSFNFYEHLFQLLPDPLLILEASHLNIQEINARVTDLTGYSASEIVGKPITRLLSLPSGANLSDFFQLNPARLSTEIKPAEIITRSGKIIPITLSSHSIEWKENQLLLLHFHASEDLVSPEKTSVPGKSDIFNEFPLLVGESQSIRQICRLIGSVAKTDATVLIQGESGTGKEVIANTLHAHSLRRSKPFIKVNCAALTDTLLESELFGHVKGAFTGAIQTRAGRFKQAHGGTLLLDEIGCMSLAGQAKLLRVLQEHEYQPVGSSETQKSNVRILASTNINLEKAVKNGIFREDLFYRLNVFSIRIAPLRERKVDVPLLAQFFLNKYCREIGKKITTLAPETVQILMEYDWPGNVRELENSIEHAVILEKKTRLFPHSLPITLFPAQSEDLAADWAAPFGLRDKLTVLEKQIILDSLIRANWIKKHAAELLQVDARNLPYLLKKHQIIETGDLRRFC